jgi:hypothetical protein
MKVYGEEELQLHTITFRWKEMVTFMLKLLFSLGKEPPVAIGYKAGGVPEFL